MINLSNFRWPYREDHLFSILAFLVLVVPLAFTFKTYDNFEMVKFVLLLVLVGVAAILFWLKKGGSPRASADDSQGSTANIWTLRGNKPFFWLAGSFLLWALLSTLYSADLLNSVFGFYYRFTSGFLFYVSWLALLTLLLKSLSRDRLEFLAKILVFDGFLIALLGFLQSIGVGYYESLSDPGFMRAPSLLGNPDFTAMFLVGVLPLSVAFIFSSKRFAAKIYFSLAAFFILLANMVLASRGAVLGLLVAVILSVFLLARYRFAAKHLKWIILGTAILLGLSLILVEVSRPQALTSVLALSDGGIALRLTNWKAAVYGIVHHPFLGVGPGNYQIFFEQYRQLFLNGKIMIFDEAHNLFLQMGATTGLPFVLSFIGLMILSFISGLRRLKQEADVLVLACLAGLAALLVAGSFNPFTISNFMLLAVLLAGCLSFTAKDYEVRLPKAAKYSGIALGSLGVAFGIVLLVSEYMFAFAYSAYFQGDYHTAYVLSRDARLINPTNHLYYIYETGSEIKLNASPDKVAGQIYRVRRIHKSQAYTLVIASNLYSALYWQTGDSEYLKDAIASVQASLKMDRYSSGAYQRLGLYNFQLGDMDHSEDYLLQGLKLEDSHLPSWMLLAKIYQLKGQRPELVSALQQALKLKPDVLQLRTVLQLARTEPDISKIPIQITIAEGPLE